MKKKVLVVGDVILDRYVTGTADRLSQEASVPVLRVTGGSFALGGAANVAANAAAQGAQVGLVGLRGRNDPYFEQVFNLLGAAGVWHEFHETPTRRYHIPRKTRFTVNGHQLLRCDDEGDPAQTPEAVARMIERAVALLPEVGVLVLSDYAKGALFGLHPVQVLIQAATKAGVPVVVDPKGTDWTRYQGATVLTPNWAEACQWADVSGPEGHKETAEIVGAAAAAKLNVPNVVVTAGAHGAFWCQRESFGVPVHTHVPAVVRRVFDVIGAGDTLVGVLAAELVKGATMAEALVRANAAAGVAVSRPGTAVVSAADVDAALWALPAGAHKVVTAQAAGERAAARQRAGDRVGYVFGEFQHLKPGHARFLAKAAAECDLLVVGVIDTPCQPGDEAAHQNLADRLEMVAALGRPHLVIPVPAGTELAAARLVKPDVVVLTEGHATGRVADYVAGHGGRVVVAPRV